MKWALWVFVSLAFVVWEAKAQDCFQHVNLGFVVDGSSGLNADEFNRLRQLITQYVRQKSSSGSSNIDVGLSVVSGNVYARQEVTDDIDQVERYFNGVDFQAGAGIRTGTGIEVIFSDLVTHQSPSGSRNVMIVLVSQQSIQPSRTRSSADFSRDIGIEVYAVGLKNMPQAELLTIGGSSSNVFRLTDILTANSLPDIRLLLDGVDCDDDVGPTTPRPVTPSPTTPRPTTPRPTTPRPTTPSPTTPRPTTPRPTTPRPTTPRPTTPRPTTPRPTTPRPTTPRPSTPRPTTPRPTTPRPTTPRPTTPRPTTPRQTTPRPTTRRPITPRPTTQRPVTTPRPTTTETTTFRPLPTESLCQEAQIIGTVGYRGHPTEPESYIQCYFPQGSGRRRRDTSTSEALMATNAIAVIRQCPYGLFWNQGTRTCELSNLVTPSGDSCSRNGLFSRGINGNCRAYFRCVNGRSVPSCCPAGHAYSPLGCIPCSSCLDTCFMSTARTFACNKYPAWDDVFSYLAYRWDRDGGTYVKQSCPESCYFNLPSCDCAFRPWQRQNDTVIPCGPKVNIPFFVGGSNDYRLNDVSLQSGAAVLNGNSAFIHVNLENDQNIANYTGPLVIEFRYMEMQEITDRRALLSSSSCTKAGYLLATVNRESILVEVSTVSGTLISLEVPTVGFKPNEWKTLRLVDNNDYITLSVSNGKDAYVTRNRAPASPYIQCGLDVGRADFVDFFSGMIERFSFYQCVPENTLA